MASPELLLNLGKLLEEQLSRNALEDTNHLGNRRLWRSRNKQVHMITVVHPNSQQLKAVILSNRLKYLLQPNLNRAHEYLASVFGSTDKVVVGLVSARPRFLQVSHLLISTVKDA